MPRPQRNILWLFAVFVVGCGPNGASENAGADFEVAFFHDYAWKSAEDVPDLIAQLKHRNATKRAEAAYFLSQIGPEAAEAVPALAATLNDRSPEAVAAAAYALGKIGPDAKAAIEDLKRLETSPDQNLRQVAQEAIGRIQDQSAAQNPGE